jgi:ABC-type sugar transport system substrate-binding protein
MSKTKARRLVSGMVALGLVAGLAACANTSNESDTGDGSNGEGRFTLEEVQAGAAPGSVGAQCFEVPKTLDEEIVLGFINPSLGFPFYKSWSEGYTAAADFYGVELFEADIQGAWEEALTKYDELSVRSPQVIGTLLPDGSALFERTTADGVILIPIDIPIEGNDYFVGVPNKESGEKAGQALVDGVQGDLDGWADRNVIVLGLLQENTEVTIDRVQSGVDVAVAGIPGAEGDTLDMGAGASVEDGQRVMADYLTANPDDVILTIAMNDESGLGALQAVKEAGRSDDVRIVTLGGGDLARDALRDGGDVVVGVVDFNPFAEGWCWVESAIAAQLGEEFAPYQVTQVLTRDNVDGLYPND